MKIKRFNFFCYLFIYYAIICIIWAVPLKRLTVVDWAGGYYFSRQPDSDQKWVNTDNINGVNISADYDAEGIKYNFRKLPSQRIIVRVLYGAPLHNYQQGEFEGLKKVIFVSAGFKNSLAQRTGFVLFKRNTPEETFSVELKKGSGFLDVRRIEVSVLAPREEFLANLPLFFLLLVFPFLLIAFIKDKRKGLCYLILALIIYLGAIMRWEEIERVAFAPPHLDISYPNIGSGYYQHAVGMKLFDEEKGFLSSYDLHEPGYPLVIKTFLTLIGESILHVRFVSFFFSIIAMLLTFLVGRQIIGSAAALFATFLISLNAFLAEQASYGLRTEIEMVMLLLFFWLCFYGIKKMKLTTWCLLAGLISGFWLIIRSFNLVLVIVISAISIIRRKIGWRQSLVTFLVFVILSVSLPLPYRYNIYKKRGSPFWDVNQYAAAHANLEFKDLAGFPKKEITLREYFFKMHSLRQLVIYNTAGLLAIGFLFYQELFSLIHQTNNLIKSTMRYGIKYTFLNFPLAALFSLVVFIIFILGLFYGSLRQVAWQIWVTIVLVISFNAFLYGAMLFRGGGILETHRTIAHALPLVALIFSSGLCRILGFKQTR